MDLYLNSGPIHSGCPSTYMSKQGLGAPHMRLPIAVSLYGTPPLFSNNNALTKIFDSLLLGFIVFLIYPLPSSPSPPIHFNLPLSTSPSLFSNTGTITKIFDLFVSRLLQLPHLPRHRHRLSFSQISVSMASESTVEVEKSSLFFDCCLQLLCACKICLGYIVLA